MVSTGYKNYLMSAFMEERLVNTGLGVLEKRETSAPYRESNPSSPIVQLVAQHCF
jgi:hypothetical protein